MDKTAVVLINLGTPEHPTPRAVRRFLGEFLADPRVVELPRLLWLPILYGFILPFRPRKVAPLYAKIWDSQGAPMRVIMEELAEGLNKSLQKGCKGQATTVKIAMTYGNPALEEVLKALDQANYDRFLFLPLYPQYASSTTGACFDLLSKIFKRWRNLPQLHFLNHYHDHPAYISALGEHILGHIDPQAPAMPLLLSYHSLPEEMIRRGDRYLSHCQETTALLHAYLGDSVSSVELCFQSKFSRAPWLRPSVSEKMQEMLNKGERSLLLCCPGFAVDCLETLEEVNIGYRAEFLAAGGESFSYIPCLNASNLQQQLLSTLISNALKSFVMSGNRNDGLPDG